MKAFEDISLAQLDEVMERSWDAYLKYRLLPFADRVKLMYAIADGLENAGDELLETAAAETNLPMARLRNERARTVFQLRSYADACADASWMDISIETADASRQPAKPDLRKTMVPLGPVAVFGASNFPFAYSTAGGDTACALAAGCSVVVKAHPAHVKTSTAVAKIIDSAIAATGMPQYLFQHIYGASFEVGEALVKHPRLQAVGFTGSLQGGMALFNWAREREQPIPVFAEMGSTNPVFILKGKLQAEGEALAKSLAASITLGVGQFCTNPGLLIVEKSAAVDAFMQTLAAAISEVAPAPMLHPGIAKAYDEKRKEALSQKGVSLLTQEGEAEGSPALATTKAENFIHNPRLHHEVFGPYSIIITCENLEEMTEVVESLQGQLTASVFATEKEAANCQPLLQKINLICGRFIFNGVPTGVEVCRAMHHGGPFPAATDSRFTSVGADGIRRFARPISYQGWPDALLPAELQNSNPLHIWRRVNDKLTNAPIEN